MQSSGGCVLGLPGTSWWWASLPMAVPSPRASRTLGLGNGTAAWARRRRSRWRRASCLITRWGICWLLFPSPRERTIFLFISFSFCFLSPLEHLLFYYCFLFISRIHKLSYYCLVFFLFLLISWKLNVLLLSVLHLFNSVCTENMQTVFFCYS